MVLISSNFEEEFASLQVIFFKFAFAFSQSMIVYAAENHVVNELVL